MQINNRQDTIDWLNSMEVDNYIVRENLTVDVKNNVRLFKKGLNFIPVQFGTVKGDFICQGNNLISLKGSPKVVNGGFYCLYNKLVSLEYFPSIVEKDINISNNLIETLENIPQEINGDFDCSHNHLKSLKNAPKYVRNQFNCSHNKLTSMIGVSKVIGGELDCANNAITSLKGISEYIGEDFYCLNNKVKKIVPNQLPLKVGGLFRFAQEHKIKRLAMLYEKIPGFTGERIDRPFNDLLVFFFNEKLNQELGAPIESYSKKMKI